MAESGQENGQNATVAVLHEVVAELRGLRADTNTRFESVEQVLRAHSRQLEEVVGRLGSMDGRLGRVENGLADLRAEVHEGFAELGAKIESAADRDRHLEEKIQ
jgi:hypothetical protein